MNTQSYAESIREAIKLEKLSQKEFCELAQISLPTLHRILRGNAPIREKTAKRINDFLELVNKRDVPQGTPAQENTVEEEKSEMGTERAIKKKSKMEVMCEILGIKKYQPFILSKKYGLYRFSDEHLERFSTLKGQWYSNDVVEEYLYELFQEKDRPYAVEEIAKLQMSGGARFDNSDS